MEIGTQFIELSYQAFLHHIRHSAEQGHPIALVGFSTPPSSCVVDDLAIRSCQVIACSESWGYEHCVCFKQGSDIQHLAEYACIDKEEMQAALLSLREHDFLWLRPRGQPFIIRHKSV